MRFCDGNGSVTGGNLADALPDDPCEYDADTLPRYGCNNLICDRCGAVVRSIAGYELIAADLKTIYEVEDLVGSGALVAAHGRQYFCRCSRHFARRNREQLALEALDIFIDIMVHWRCNGHKAPTLPYTFDGVPIPLEELPALVERSIRAGWTPDSAREEDRVPGVWLARLYFWLEETPHQEIVELTLFDLMEDDDLQVKSCVLKILRLVRPPRAAARCFEVLAGDRQGWQGHQYQYACRTRPETLVDILWRLAGPLVRTHTEARLLLEREVLSRGRGTRTLYTVLALHHPAWFIEHIHAMLAATPQERAALERSFRILPRDGTYRRAKEELANPRRL